MHHIVQAALDGVSARRVIGRAFEDAALRDRLVRSPIRLLAVGKASPAMAACLMADPDVRVRSALAIGTHPAAGMPASLEFIAAAHPYPDERSQRAARAALGMAARTQADEHLVLLVSGGASALMADAVEGVSFADKLQATRALMLAGADIHQLNALRKHLSCVKGGWLAAACKGQTTTLALSDVVGDDLSVIGSGPGLPDPSTWHDVRQAIDARGAWTSMPGSVRARIEGGCAGMVPETPKPSDARLSRASGAVVGRAADAVGAMCVAAADRGYTPIVMDGRVTGEARASARAWLERARRLAESSRGPVCVLSSGETTVQVSGDGVGGRNLEFALALVEPLAGCAGVMAASVGTDGIDGTSDVAGATVDGDTRDRARRRGLPPVAEVLARNDSFHYFAPLGDVVRTGRTDTNVGDIQMLLIRP